MTTQSLTARLKSLSDSARGTSQLILRLAKLAPSPDSQDLNESEVRLELGSEIHASLKELEEEFELVKQEAEDVTGSATWGSGARRFDSEKERERVAVVTHVERLGEDLRLARAQFRRAQLQAKRNAEAAKRKERERLFAGVQEGSRSTTGRRKGQDKLSQDELLLNASSDVTAALRRTHQLMQSELQRSQFAHQTLQQSTAALNSLNESYGTLDTLLSSSKSLISTLVNSQKSDTWYLETAVWILVYTILWLVFRRWFYGPIRYLLYLPAKWMLSLFFYFANAIVSVIAGSSVASNSSQSPASSSTRSLIVKPSATGRSHKINPNMPQQGIRAGAGGAGAKQASEGLVEEVGKMTDETVRQEQEQQQGEEEEQGGGQGGEGTVLRERGEDEQPNPKKRVWEEPPAQEGGKVRDEL